MNNIRRLFIGDIHFNFDLYDYEFIFKKLLEEIQPEEIYFLGDIFNSKRDINYDFLKEIKKIFNILIEDKKLKKVRFLLGNHDISSEKENLYDIFIFPKDKNIRIITDIELENDILYLPYRKFDSYEKVEKFIKDVRDVLKKNNKQEDLIILSHIDFYELYDSKTSKNIINGLYFKELVQLAGIRNSILISGHVHKFKYFEFERENIKIYHLGNYLNTNFNDKDLYGVLLLQENESFNLLKQDYNIKFFTVEIKGKKDLVKVFFYLSLFGFKYLKIRIHSSLDIGYYYHFFEDIFEYYKNRGLKKYFIEVFFEDNIRLEDKNIEDFTSIIENEINEFVNEISNTEEEFSIDKTLLSINPDINLDLLRKYEII